MRFFISLLGVLALAACSPKYDWRDLQPAKDPFAMMLPAKPAAMTRDINLDGNQVTMHMHGALVQGNSFTAAWLQLDESTIPVDKRDAGRARALAAMQKGMLNNINGKVVNRSERTISLIDKSGQPVGRLPAIELTIDGTAQGKPVVMRALFAGFGARLYQFVVLGPNPPAEQVKTFLDSVRVRTEMASAVAGTYRQIAATAA